MLISNEDVADVGKQGEFKIAMPPNLYLLSTTPGRFIQEAEQYAADWLTRHHILPSGEDRAKLSAMGPGALAAHCFPPATRAQMGLLAAWMSWLFVIDDRNDEGHQGRMPDVFAEELNGVYESALTNNTPSSGPLSDALKEIWEQIHPRMSTFWKQRFRHNMASFFSAYVSQAAHRALSQVPALDTFPQLRRDAGAIWPSFDLIEWVQGYALPPSLYMSRYYQELLTSAADVVCWTNDLLTTEKEHAFDDVYNYVFVLQHARSCDLQEAINEVVQQVEMRINTFLRAEAALPKTIDRLKLDVGLQEQVYANVKMLRAWIRGHVAWGETTNRYVPAIRL